ncbi:Kip1p Ecym_4688 [Eremothecium cymbalariae DBVPG|uniref:Kinesin-like protein KIP1 n=1 Tax=Eremothecium cymbalariae (strain CBS 270.75 / DBVPG 7215 / KCTC 17166 / NRRL Y-17582) TaxID=931890 RepID=G8JSI7_ERECY|nr:hypothetical protein Ecym_4688 [Eremothecium cymbalariae DBVPG\
MSQLADKVIKKVPSAGSNVKPHGKPLARAISSSLPTASQKRVRSNMMVGSEEQGYNIKVYVRCRSRNVREIKEKSSVVVSTLGSQGREIILSNQSTGNNKTYTFDQVFGVESDQESLFDKVARAYITEMLEGYNCTVFAYGQTGTGKTYTMSGDISVVGASLEDPNYVLLSEHAGIIPRVLVELFQQLQRESEDYSVKVSFLELYNEKLRDLLVEDKEPLIDEGGIGGGVANSPETIRIYDNLKLDRSNSSGHSIMVKGMEEMYIRSAQEGLKLLMEGSLKRKVAATRCNDLSSRSHTIFTITTNVTKIHPISGEQYVKIGKLNLVDLAGSENINRSGAENKRAQEAGLINKSLLTLGRVINALVDHSQHIPYRESKLTRLLQDSLGGKTKTCIIATVSPAKTSMEETASTLEYATRAKSIKNTPQINQLMAKESCILGYIKEIEKLRKNLKANHAKEGIYITEEKYETYESNCILVEEQQAKIDNLQEQIKRFKEKYLEQTKLVKEKDTQVKMIKSINERITMYNKKLTDYLDKLRFRVEDYEIKVNDIHNNNMKLLLNLNNNRESIYDSLISKTKHIEMSNELLLKEVNGLILIRDTLKSYNERFKTVITGVFHELQEKMQHVLHLSHQNNLNLDLGYVDAKFGEIIKVVEECSQSLLLNLDQSLAGMKSETIQNAAYSTVELQRESDTLYERLKEFIEKIKCEVDFSLQNVVKGIHTRGVDVIDLVRSTKDELVSGKLKLQSDLEEQKQKHSEEAMDIQSCINQLIEQERRRTSDTMKASYEFLKKQMEETELRQALFENNITEKLQGIIANYNNGMVNMSSYGIEKTHLNAMDGICSIESQISKAQESLQNDMKQYRECCISVCSPETVTGKFDEYNEKVKVIIDEKLVPRLNHMMEGSYSSLAAHFKSYDTNVVTTVDNKRGVLCSVVGDLNTSANSFVSDVNSLVKYFSQEHRDNVKQIIETQGEIFHEQIGSVKEISQQLEKLTKDKSILENLPRLSHDMESAVGDLPSIDKIIKNFDVLDDSLTASDDTSSKSGDILVPVKENIKSAFLEQNEKIFYPTTPMPIPDHPLTKVLAPRSINSSIKNLRRMTMDITENIRDSSTDDDMAGARDLNRRYTFSAKVLKEEQ